MEVTQIVWLVLLVVFAILEGVTAGLVSIWFCGGAVAALLLSVFWPAAVWAQMLAFLIVSILLLLALRPFARRVMMPRQRPTNADANIGKVCQVVTEIQPARIGRVKLEGLEWAARSDFVLPVGSWCRVDGIEGVKLVVTPVPPPAAAVPGSY